MAVIFEKDFTGFFNVQFFIAVDLLNKLNLKGLDAIQLVPDRFDQRFGTGAVIVGNGFPCTTQQREKNDKGKKKVTLRTDDPLTFPVTSFS